MNRTIQFGDRRPLEPRMDYCRLDYEVNRDAGETLNLTIQIFDQRQTQFLRRYSDLTPEQADVVIQQVLEQGWNTVLTNKFQDWAICYLQRPKVVEPQAAAAKVARSYPVTHRVRPVGNQIRTASFSSQRHTVQSTQSTSRNRRRQGRSPNSSTLWTKARSAGTRVAAFGLAAGVITLGIKGAHTLVPAGASWAIAAIEQRVKRTQATPPIDIEVSEQPSVSVAQPITSVADVQIDGFQQAVMLAEQAVLEGRVAESADDWKDLAMQWHEAARLMHQVPNSDERYALAQNRAALYADHREQSLIETALHSVVFPIENRQRIPSENSSASFPASRRVDVSASPLSSAAEDSVAKDGARENAEPSEQPDSQSLTVSAIAPDNQCQSRFDAMVEPILTAPAYRAGQWGVHAQSISSGKVLYQHNSDDFFVPASNIKLYTTAAAVTWVEQAQAPQNAAQNAAQASTAPSSSNLFNPALTTPALPAIASASLEKSVPSLTDLDLEFPGLIQNANLFSNNWSAEILLEKMGGPTAVKELLDQVGINPMGYHQADGSGLSRSNLVTPQSLVETLAVMHDRAGAETFFGTLPVAGQRGTLKNRFHNTVAYGKVRAKTGTLLGVRSLSGYLEHPVHGRVAFGIVVNYPGHSGYGLNSPIDQIVVQLMQLGEC